MFFAFFPQKIDQGADCRMHQKTFKRPDALEHDDDFFDCFFLQFERGEA
jgi:hypothetical protein